MQLGMRDEGGCPFVHFDDVNLLQTLADTVIKNTDVIKEIISLRNAKKPNEACNLYMAALVASRKGNESDSNIVIEYESPLEYYCNIKTLLCKSLSW